MGQWSQPRNPPKRSQAYVEKTHLPKSRIIASTDRGTENDYFLRVFVLRLECLKHSYFSGGDSSWGNQCMGYARCLLPR